MPDAIVVDYDPVWPESFDRLAAVLAPALGGLAAAIHHVGSTAIPGMAAKPVIDIDIELVPGVCLEAATAVLQLLGYVYQGDQGIPDRYAYSRRSPDVPFTEARPIWPAHHLYVCPSGSAELARHLVFRDKLRASPELRQAYLELKQAALARAQGVRQIYVDEKARLGETFFREVLG